MLNLEIRRLADNTPMPVSIAALAMEVRGKFRFPNEEAQSQARTAEPGVGSTGPALIVRCRDRQDVMRCLDFALRHDLLVTMRNGHNEQAEWDGCDQGMAIDLSALSKPQ